MTLNVVYTVQVKMCKSFYNETFFCRYSVRTEALIRKKDLNDTASLHESHKLKTRQIIRYHHHHSLYVYYMSHLGTGFLAQ